MRKQTAGANGKTRTISFIILEEIEGSRKASYAMQFLENWPFEKKRRGLFH